MGKANLVGELVHNILRMEDHGYAGSALIFSGKDDFVSPQENQRKPLTPTPTTTPETEKSEFEVKHANLPSYIEPGRPDFHAVISKVVEESTVDNRVLVAACGPGGLVDGVRDAVKRNTKKSGPSVELHVEAFG